MNLAADIDAILERLTRAGITTTAEGDKLRLAPKRALTENMLAEVRAHKAELLAALANKHTGVFEFALPSDPINDDEALVERAAIMMEANGWAEAVALQEARWEAHRERCWRAFLRNAQIIRDAPEARWEELLGAYESEAAKRYGKKTAGDMAASLSSWVVARGVH